MHRTRYLIGLLTLALTLLGASMLWSMLSAAQDHPGLQLRIDFRDARGLRAGADVRYRGVTVGTVANVQIAGDGTKAVVSLVLDEAGTEQACLNSSFWIVSPRFSGLTSGASGLDTLVRDTYVAFLTPPERGTRLLPGSLLAGAERPPPTIEPDALEPIAHGDLLMSLLVTENHGLRAGSPAVFRGTQTGDVRSVQLAQDGSHVEVVLRISNRHRHTVTDQTEFWVARPYVSGALLSGFTVADVASLVSPFVSYVTDPGKGAPVVDGYRAAASAVRPDLDASEVPSAALVSPARPVLVPGDPLVLVRIVYAAVEEDAMSADDPVQSEGTGVLYLDGSGRAVVLTARSAADGAYITSDTFGGEPDIAKEQIKVKLPDGPVLRAHRVWVAPDGLDLTVLVLDEPPPALIGTPGDMLAFSKAPIEDVSEVRAVQADGQALAASALSASDLLPSYRGGAIVRDGKVLGVLGQSGMRKNSSQASVFIDSVPQDLRPRP